MPVQPYRPASLAEAAQHLIDAYDEIAASRRYAEVAAGNAANARTDEVPAEVVMAYDALAREAEQAIPQAESDYNAAVGMFNEMLNAH